MVTGIDHDPEMIRWAGRRFGSLPGLSFEVGRAEQLPLADASTDGVVATSLLGLLSDAGTFLDEASRVLRPGGVLVATATNSAAAVHLARRMPRGPRSCPIRLLSRSELGRTLAGSGFEPVELRPYSVFVVLRSRPVPPLRIAARLERRLGGSLGELAGRNLLAVGVKS